MPAPWWLRLFMKTKWGRQRIEWGYGLVPLRVLIINFVFQRILGVNSGVPFSVNFRSIVIGGQNITIGQRVGTSLALSGGIYINGWKGLEIGDGTFIGPNVGILTVNHDLYNRDLYTNDGSVRIGRNCWLGMNSMILPGVTLGDNVTVGAGSVVTHSYPSNVVIAGNPARVILELNANSIIEYRKRHRITQMDDIVQLTNTAGKSGR